MATRKKLDASTLRKYAVEAEVDPTTIAKELLKPGSVRGMPGHRAREVLARHGLVDAGKVAARAAS